MDKSGKLATEQTTRHVTKPQNPEGTKKGFKIKVEDNATGKTRWIDGSRGVAKDPNGDPVGPGGPSPATAKPQKVPKLGKE